MKKRIVTVTNIYNRRADLRITLQTDKKFPSHIFIESPRYASLTEEKVIALCDALTDMIEGN